MRAIKTQNGYTIVETLIVLAVTGAMFVVAAVMISGQVSRYQFRDGVLNSQNTVQSVINDVQTGYFSLATSSSAPCNSGDNTVPGDSNCVYIGKIVDFGVSGQVTTYPIIANIDSASPIGQPLSNLTYLSNRETIRLPGNMDYTPSPTSSGCCFAIIYTNYTNSAGVTSFNGGAQSVGLYGRSPTNNLVPLTAGKIICLQNGPRKAALVIGANRATNVEINYEPTASECP
jgi:type II secretory pathway pseudopilin PulG